MATYLVTWNPRKWQWKDLPDAVDAVRRDGITKESWSCGRTKRIRAGDRLFLLRQGEEPRGLIASGWATSEPYRSRHWADPSGTGQQALYVDAEWDVLAAAPIIAREELDRGAFVGVHWNTQASGITIEAEVARHLEQEWGRRVGSYFEPAADEVIDANYPEGATRRVTINAHERNAGARAACIAHYGPRCVVCDIDFAAAYGTAAAGIIHVHHLTPVSQVRARYTVDPIRDLRPVCPNCHAVIHRREPPYTPQEVARMRRSSGKG